MSSRLVLCTKLLLLYNFWYSGWLDVIWCPVRVWIAGRLLGWTPDPKVSEPFWIQGESTYLTTYPMLLVETLTQRRVYLIEPQTQRWVYLRVFLDEAQNHKKKVSLPRLRADPKLSLFRWTPDPKVSLPRCSPNPKVSLTNPRPTVGRWATILLALAKSLVI